MATTEQTSEPAVTGHAGGCHCGAVRFSFETRLSLEDLAPRACDCDFCTRHRAAWVSDAAGVLRIGLAGVRRYRQGSQQAEFLFCGDCGVLVGVVCPDDAGILRGAVNRNSFDQRGLFGAEVTASPQRLAPEEKRTRWSQLWTPVASR